MRSHVNPDSAMKSMSMDRWLSARQGKLQLLLNDPITVNSSTMVKEAKEQVTKHTQQ